MKAIYTILLLIFTQFCVGQGITYTNVDIFVGKSKTITPYTSSIISKIKEPSHGTATINGSSFIYTPPTYSCLDTLIIRYQYIIGGIKRFNFQSYAFRINNSFLTAGQDYAHTEFNASVYVPVLDNDYVTDSTGNSNNIILTSITNVNNGSAIIFGDRILFKPNKDFSGLAYLDYTVCNTETTNCKTSHASIYVNKQVIPQIDSMWLYTAKDDDIAVITPDSKFIVSVGPQNGTLTASINNYSNYHPNTGFVGTENISFYNYETNRIFNVRISVLDKPYVNKYAIPDVFYTAENTSLLIDALQNDHAVNAYIANYTKPNPNHGKLTFYNNKFSFTPENGFNGVAKFKYNLKNYSGIPSAVNVNEWTTVDIVVSNHYPSKQVFEFSTQVNTPLILNYTVPISGWMFSLVDGPIFGSISNTSSEIIYTPDSQFYGTDYFSVRYSIGTAYRDIKVYVSVDDAVGNCSYNCVWPGDANSDGIVDIYDIIPVGTYVGKTGGNRLESIEWKGQMSQNWNYPLITDVNIKHVDTDGDGEVNSSDIVALDVHYGKTHNLTPSKIIDYKSIPLEFQMLTSNPKIGDTVEVDLILGSVGKPIIESNGFVLEFIFDEKVVDYNSLSMYFYGDSWLTYNSPCISLIKKYPNNRIDFGIVRTGNVASGLGKIARMSFVLRDSLSSNRAASVDRQLIPNTKYAIDADNSSVVIYKNPTSGILNIRTTDSLKNYTIYSINGEYLISGDTNQVDVSEFENGVYIIKIETSEGVCTKKFEVIK